MKQFAFPLSVKCADVKERDECINILKSLGYVEIDRDLHDSETLVITNCSGYGNMITAFVSKRDYLYGRHHINHFNPAIIRDIAAACTNDEWHKMEPVIRHDGSYGYTNDLHRLVSVEYSSHRRPTIAEICEHHGYEIKGRDIVKKVETVSNCDKSYCETARQLDEAKAEIKRLEERLIPVNQMSACVEQVGNAIKLMKDLKEASQKTKKLEEMTDADNHELARLRSKIDELVNKLQYNDKLHVKELEMLTDTITELSRDKAELIEKINCLLAPAPAEFNPISCMHALEDRPISLTEREKRRLLRLAERIEKLIK